VSSGCPSRFDAAGGMAGRPLCERSPSPLAIVSVTLQLAALPLLGADHKGIGASCTIPVAGSYTIPR
jgi:hypothetical protein